MPKLGMLLKRSFVGHKGPALVPEEGSAFNDPNFLVPAATTSIGAASGGSLSGAAKGGLKGLLAGLGGVGSAAIARHAGANPGMQLGVGAGGGLLSLLLASKILDGKPEMEGRPRRR